MIAFWPKVVCPVVDGDVIFRCCKEIYTPRSLTVTMDPSRNLASIQAFSYGPDCGQMPVQIGIRTATRAIIVLPEGL